MIEPVGDCIGSSRGMGAVAGERECRQPAGSGSVRYFLLPRYWKLGSEWAVKE